MMVCFQLITVCHTLLPKSEFQGLLQDRQLVMVDADLSQLAIFQSQIDVFTKKKRKKRKKCPSENEPNAADFRPRQPLIKLIGNSGNHLQIIYSF